MIPHKTFFLLMLPPLSTVTIVVMYVMQLRYSEKVALE